MVAFHTVKAGDRLFECRHQKMGNTTMSQLACWDVKVVEVHEHHVIAAWNGNPPKRFGRCSVEKWRRSPPKKPQPDPAGSSERER